MIETVNRTAAVTSANTQSSTATTNDDSASNFAQILETATASSTASSTSAAVVSAAAGKSDFVSGRIGIDLNEQGIPQSVHYFDEQGELLTSSSFSAVQILKNANEFGISLTDLQGLGEQMDAAGVGYRPYELYPDTGSNHGIDFDNLIAGGLGTAYDWREDPLVGQKGASGQRRLEAARALAEELGISSTLATPRAGVVPETSSSTSAAAAAVTGTAAVAAATSVAAATATDTGLTQSADTTANTADAVEDILVTSGSADSSDTGAALADAISDVISDVATAIFGDTASTVVSSSNTTDSSSSDTTASVLSEQQQNELLQLANNLSRQQPALAQHLLAVLQASLESKVA